MVRGTLSEDIKDEYGRLRSEFVARQTDHLRDYSTNLLGKSIPSDLIEYNNQKWYFFLKLSDFNDVHLDEKIQIKVFHTPIEVNFWHCSIRWFFDNQDSSTLTKSQSKKIWERARSYIIMMAIFEEPFFEEIPEKFYIETQSLF